MSDLLEWSKIIEEQHKQEMEKDKKFNDNLPDPDAVYYENDNYIFGYWKTENGVIQMQKWPNSQWNRHSSKFFPHEMITAINIANNKGE